MHHHVYLQNKGTMRGMLVATLADKAAALTRANALQAGARAGALYYVTDCECHIERIDPS